jgi:hypothetical protein
VHHAGLQRLDEHAAPRIRVRILLRQPPGDGLQLGLRLRDRHAVLQTRDDVEVVRSASGSCPKVERERNPGVGFHLEAETLRQDADDEVRLSVEIERLPEDPWIRPERRLPEAMAEHRHVRGRAVFLERKAPAERGRYAQHLEELPRRPPRLHVSRLAVTRDIHVAPAVGGDPRKHGALLPPIEDVRTRHAVAEQGGVDEVLVKAHDAIGARVVERPQQQRVDHAEERDVRADTYGHRQPCDRGEAGGFSEEAQTEAEVLRQVGNGVRAGSSRPFFQTVEIATEPLIGVELTQNHAVRVVARQPLGSQLAISIVEVLLQFLRYLVLGRRIQAGSLQATADLLAPLTHVPAPRSG